MSKFELTDGTTPEPQEKPKEDETPKQSLFEFIQIIGGHVKRLWKTEPAFKSLILKTLLNFSIFAGVSVGLAINFHPLSPTNSSLLNAAPDTISPL